MLDYCVNIHAVLLCFSGNKFTLFKCSFHWGTSPTRLFYLTSHVQFKGYTRNKTGFMERPGTGNWEPLSGVLGLSLAFSKARNTGNESLALPPLKNTNAKKIAVNSPQLMEEINQASCYPLFFCTILYGHLEWSGILSLRAPSHFALYIMVQITSLQSSWVPNILETKSLLSRVKKAEGGYQ